MSEFFECSGEIWRIIEAQHKVSTMKLADNYDEQRRLEELLDASKPPVPIECQELHWLLFTPFRYPARSDSRFRRVGPGRAVFYAAEKEETAVAEFAFWRILFFLESPETKWPSNPLEATSFMVSYEAKRCVDLMKPPYDDRPEIWVHPTDYGKCHEIADHAFENGADAIRSVSARDPKGQANVTLLTCRAFRSKEPETMREWRLSLSSAGPYATTEYPSHSLSFGREAFARDPRIASMNWDR
ncbi:MAG: RES family NAD+ phosphorylase [Pseudomonadota bacterium]